MAEMPLPHRVAVLEKTVKELAETVKAHDYQIGQLVRIAADVERYTDAVADERTETRSLVAGVLVRFDELETKLGVVNVKAETADMKAEHAGAKAETAVRASLTNEADALPAPPLAPSNVDEHPSRGPEEKAVASLAGVLAVDAVRKVRRSSLVRVALLVAAAATAGTAAGSRLRCDAPLLPPAAPATPRP